MRRTAIVTALLLLAAPAFAQSIGEKTGVNSVLGISPSTADFVSQAAISDMFEIQSSQLAVERAPDEPTKAFARQMVTAHEKTTSELKAFVAAGTVQATPPSAMDDAHTTLLADLQKLSGEDFAEEYRADQVEAHEDAVSLFERYANGGDNPALKEWAGKTLPELRHHLEMAEALEK
jgi:putative membrane protein